MTGLMSKDDFTKLASPYLPESSLDEFTDNTFKLFDEVTAIMSTYVDDFFDENNSEWIFWQGPWRPAWLWGVCLGSACHRDQGQPGAPRLDFRPHFWPSEILENQPLATMFTAFLLQESSANIDARKGEEVTEILVSKRCLWTLVEKCLWKGAGRSSPDGVGLLCQQ